MKYGLIGEKLTHSFSPEIHKKLGDYPYELVELNKEQIGAFMTEKDFSAINVTIPYKKEVIPYLDEISDEAKKIGAVNTVVNRNGKLYGYNTDYIGMSRLIMRVTDGKKLSGKVLILGTGGTAVTAKVVAHDLGADEIITVSRTKTDETVTYTEAIELHTDASFIINCTPVGMYPNDFESPIDLTPFTQLSGVIDAIYNPLRTPLIRQAKKLCIPAEGGLYMLVSQAVAAYGYFFDTEAPTELCDRIYNEVLLEKENIVLVGMPSCGKSSIGKALSVTLRRHFYDSDEPIAEDANMSIPEIFLRYGETHFRYLETKSIKKLSSGIWNAVIATGGGAVIREENVDMLKANGRLIFIDRSLENLTPTPDRPLSGDIDSLRRRYEDRYPIYTSVCDDVVDGNGTVAEVASSIIKLLKDKQ
ncbi:MAG: shikimate dehydrogenase [Ruminococcaceae bacterium]|nr:shikimate dehydrogenase [Oscillospiraceae bacterium]